MDGFSSDDAVDFSPPKKPIGKTVMKWIVVTKKKFVSAPRGSMWGDMKTSGEARYIGINTLWTAEMLMDQLRAVFPCLQSKERNQIRVFRTTSRGNVFTRLSEYLPNAKELLQLFKGTKSPRIYLYMKNSKGSPWLSGSRTKSSGSSPNSMSGQSHTSSNKNQTLSSGKSTKNIAKETNRTASVKSTIISKRTKNTEIKKHVTAAKSVISSPLKSFPGLRKLAAKTNLTCLSDSSEESPELGGSSSPWLDESTSPAANSPATQLPSPSFPNQVQFVHDRDEGLVVGEIKESSIFSRINESASALDRLNEVSGLVILPVDDLDEACLQAFHLQRPMLFLIAEEENEDLHKFLRSLSNSAEEMEGDFPLIVFIQEGSHASEELYRKFSMKGKGKLILCFPLNKHEMEIKLIQTGFVYTQRFVNAMEELQYSRRKPQLKKKKQSKLLVDPHYVPDSEEKEVVFRENDPNEYDKGDDSTLLLCDDDLIVNLKQQEKERKNGEKRKKEEREKEREFEIREKEREPRENEEKEREERERRERRERKERERKEREMEERELRENEEKEREPRENEEKEREERERRERERKEREMEEREPRENEEKEREERERREKERENKETKEAAKKRRRILRREKAKRMKNN